MKKFIIVLILGLIASLSLAGCSGHPEQDMETILDSQLLADKGIAISIPEHPYYTFVHRRRGELDIEVALRVLGEHGVYYFTPGGWTDELIADIVLVGEEGILFAKDFLGIELSRPLSFVFNITEPDENHPLPVWGGGGVLGTSTFISMDRSLLPTIIVHEAVHGILRYDERMTNFPQAPESSPWATALFLEEGLCDVIDFLFARQTALPYRTNYGNRHLHTDAVRMLQQHDYFSDEEEFGTRYPQLMSYQTAASFVYFLLEHHGTIEDFMRVFDDIYLMEEVFGQNMEGMIVDWLAYLEGNW